MDDDVFEIIQDMNLKFCINKGGYFQSTSHIIKLPCMTKKKRLLLHQLVFIIKTKTEPTSTVDHIDRNKSNNCFFNLRLATVKQQNNNRGKMKSNTSSYIGVCHQHYVDKRRKKNNVYEYWRTQIRKPNNKIETKLFPYTENGKIAAAHYYDTKAREYFGKFAVLNFPDEIV